MTTTNDLAAIRKLTDAATPGPWGVGNGTNIVRGLEVTGRGSYTCIQSVAEVTDEDDREDWDHDDFVEVDPEDDAEFIAAARTLVPALCDEIEQLRAELKQARADERNTIAADIENMPINLGDTGWKHIERKAIEAGYPAEIVRRRRTRDDFTTDTIEVAYQYGYRQAAKVARGEVSR